MKLIIKKYGRKSVINYYSNSYNHMSFGLNVGKIFNTTKSAVSPEFNRNTIKMIKKLPSGYKESLYKFLNIEYSTAKSYLKLYPHKKNIIDESAPKGKTLDDVKGVFQYDDYFKCGDIVFFEKPIVESKTGCKLQGVFSHETGHAVSKMFEIIFGKEACQTKGFQKALKKDLTEFQKKPKNNIVRTKNVLKKNSLNQVRKKLSYYIQKSTKDEITERGAKEMFAEMFAVTRGEGAREETTKLLLEHFPHTRDYMIRFHKLYSESDRLLKLTPKKPK